MPPSPSAGLLAFLLALPSLAVVVPPASEASLAADLDTEAVAAAADPTPGDTSSAEARPGVLPPAEAMDARLRRLSAAIRARASALDESERGPLAGEPWLAAGGWLNGNNRGWANRGWPNRVHGGSYYRTPQMWANFRPGWNNFRNGPSFLNW